MGYGMWVSSFQEGVVRTELRSNLDCVSVAEVALLSINNYKLKTKVISDTELSVEVGNQESKPCLGLQQEA